MNTSPQHNGLVHTIVAMVLMLVVTGGLAYGLVVTAIQAAGLFTG